jgi:glycosyltransferase involved in cell wall biosynthesis
MPKEMSDKKTICLCAIVKNESRTISRLIKSCKSIIDYYVIVDTGSTDDTISIIKSSMGSIPGEVHSRPWINFGKNRSELMELAYGKSDYLLLADADFEYKISSFFHKSELIYDWYHLRYLGDIDFAQILLVSGKKKWKYLGVTHEYIEGENCGESPELKSISILHHADGGTRSNKLTRDRDLLEKAILEDTSNTRNYFYLAQTYENLGEYNKASKYYEERARRGGWPEEVFYSLFQIGVCQYHLKKIDNAILQFIETYAYRPTRFEPLYMLGMVYREQKKYHMARLMQEEVIRMPYPTEDKLFIHTSNKRYLADFELGICYYWMGEYDKSKKHCLAVKQMNNIPKLIFDQNEQNMKFTDQKLENKKTGRNDIIYVSMFTENTPYEEEVKILKSSLDKFGLPYEIVKLRNQGSWEKNTQMKPSVLKSVMDKYNKDVVWIDADAEILENPELFYKLNCDMSFHHLKEWDEKMTGTMYFKNNLISREVINKWINVNETNNLPDAQNFQKVMEEQRGLKIVDLPVEYINVQDIQFLQCSDPIITHHQASRRFKEIVYSPPEKLNSPDIIRQELKKCIHGEKSCAVIGNGPFETDLSKQIDKSFVMRCNNFKLGYKEIGSRIDVNISSLFHEIIPDHKVDYPIFGVLPISDVSKILRC